MNSIYDVSAYILLDESISEIENFVRNHKAINKNTVAEITEKSTLIQEQISIWKEQNPFIGLDKLELRIANIMHCIDAVSEKSLENETELETEI